MSTAAKKKRIGMVEWKAESFYCCIRTTYHLCFIDTLTLLNRGLAEGKAQIAASNKQNLKMKPADAQRLPCHKMTEKTLSLQQQMMSLQPCSSAVLIIDFPSVKVRRLPGSSVTSRHVWKSAIIFIYTKIAVSKENTRKTRTIQW